MGMGDHYERITRDHDAELYPCRLCRCERRRGADWFGPDHDLCEDCAIKLEAWPRANIIDYIDERLARSARRKRRSRRGMNRARTPEDLLHLHDETMAALAAWVGS